MKNCINICIALVLLIWPCKAQIELAELQKKFIIERSLSNQLLVFIANNKYGVINNKGKVLLPAVYSRVYNTNFNLFVVEKDSAIGIVKADNTPVLPFVFEQANIISPRRVHVLKNGVTVIISLQNKFLADTADAPVTVYQATEDMSIMEIREDELVAPAQSNYPPWYYKNELVNDGIIYAIRNSDTVKTDYTAIYKSPNYDFLYKYLRAGKWGLMDDKQKEYTEAIYDELYEVYNSKLFAAKIGKNKMLYSFANGQLNALFNEPVSILEGFNRDKIAIVMVERDYLGFGLIRADGTYLLGPIKGNISKMGESFFVIRYDTTNRIDVVNKNLQSILPAGASYTGSVGNQLLVIGADKKMGVVHAAGYILVPPVYDELFFGNTDDEDNTCSQARKGDKWGLVDLQGKEVIPFVYDRMHLFEKGLCVVKKNNKTGVINLKNKMIVPFIYDDAADYFNQYGILKVKKNGLYGLVDKTGKEILPLLYEQVDEDFEGGLAGISKGGKWGFVNTEGKIIIPLQYDEVKSFYLDKATVRKGAHWFNIDNTGKIVE